ncbi:hypothetical protein ACFTSD_01525 [Nocardiaceae bacterium NPDC056970]
MPVEFNHGIAATVRGAATSGLRDAAEVVKQEAVERCPKEADTRSSAGTATDGLEAIVYFDSADAVRQHEEVGGHHRDGEAKYLENAVNATRATVADIVGEAIRRSIA